MHLFASHGFAPQHLEHRFDAAIGRAVIDLRQAFSPPVQHALMLCRCREPFLGKRLGRQPVVQQLGQAEAEGKPTHRFGDIFGGRGFRQIHVGMVLVRLVERPEGHHQNAVVLAVKRTHQRCRRKGRQVDPPHDRAAVVENDRHRPGDGSPGRASDRDQQHHEQQQGPMPRRAPDHLAKPCRNGRRAAAGHRVPAGDDLWPRSAAAALKSSGVGEICAVSAAAPVGTGPGVPSESRNGSLAPAQ